MENYKLKIENQNKIGIGLNYSKLKIGSSRVV